ncbi:MAG: cbb3-type cytochrome c oxidase subunit I, partial [Bacteroidales bacterium]|nr:cbb3-type cytochrome c oxidase subunit I [Bacteroidales bacterium]
MSKNNTFLDGVEGLFKPDSLTPMQKLTLRFVVVGILYYGLSAIEGMMMRVYQIEPVKLLDSEHFFAVMTAHPLVGIFGSSYSIVFGAFLFLVPFFMKKPLYSIKLGNWSFILVTFGTLLFWLTGFISHFAPLYTLYWPLPADFTQFSPVGGLFFILGIALVMVGTLFFVFNIFKTITYTPGGHQKVHGRAMLASATGFSWKESIFRKKANRRENLVSLPVAAIARGTVDTLLNALIITFTGVLILVYMVASILGFDLKETAIDALLYKNWFWWGLDLIADGLVLIFVAGTWYILATLITGKDLYMAKIARLALWVEMVVSWTV